MRFCVIDSTAVIGDRTHIGDFVEIREGVTIGADCYIDSRVTFTGDAEVGDETTIRNSVIVARGASIGCKVFISPQVMFENLTPSGEAVGGAEIQNGAFIGTNATLAAGVSIGAGAIVGAAANVRCDVPPGETWVGNPARRIR